MTITPLNGHVLATPRPRDEVTPGGVVLPERTQDDSDEAVVAADFRDPDTGIKLATGDRIVHTMYGGSEVKMDQTTFLLIPFRHILAVYRG